VLVYASFFSLFVCCFLLYSVAKRGSCGKHFDNTDKMTALITASKKRYVWAGRSLFLTNITYFDTYDIVTFVLNVAIRDSELASSSRNNYMNKKIRKFPCIHNNTKEASLSLSRFDPCRISTNRNIFYDKYAPSNLNACFCLNVMN
jgi:hypothetical protein